MKLKLVSILLLALSSCNGIGSTYDPVVENKDDQYYADLQYCQQLSQQKRYFDGEMGNSVLAGVGMGGLIAGFGGGMRGIGAGAVMGSGISMGVQTMRSGQEKKYIIVQCLRQRGHNVIL